MEAHCGSGSKNSNRHRELLAPFLLSHSGAVASTVYGVQQRNVGGTGHCMR